MHIPHSPTTTLYSCLSSIPPWEEQTDCISRPILDKPVYCFYCWCHHSGGKHLCASLFFSLRLYLWLLLPDDVLACAWGGGFYEISNNSNVLPLSKSWKGHQEELGGVSKQWKQHFLYSLRPSFHFAKKLDHLHAFEISQSQITHRMRRIRWHAVLTLVVSSWMKLFFRSVFFMFYTTTKYSPWHNKCHSFIHYCHKNTDPNPMWWKTRAVELICPNTLNEDDITSHIRGQATKKNIQSSTSRIALPWWRCHFLS